jgi:hypothetical protein
MKAASYAVYGRSIATRDTNLVLVLMKPKNKRERMQKDIQLADSKQMQDTHDLLAQSQDGDAQ